MSDAPVSAPPTLAFAFDLPTRIRFGPGARGEVGGVAGRFGARIALAVGRSFGANPAAAACLASLEAAGVEVVLALESAGEPDDRAVLDAAGRLREARPDAVVAIGGGSVLDLAKAAALVPSADDLARWLGGERVEEPVGLPLIALPTTAGSGAEVSHAAIVLDRGAGRKRGIRGRGVAARVAIVDPELCMGASADVVAGAGFDALAHAVETSASRASSPLTIGLAGLALARLLEAVPRTLATADDADGWGWSAYAALLMGINLANSTTCLPHRLQYPVGAFTGTSHARGVAALFPAWLERTRDVAPAALASIGRAGGLAAADAPDDRAADALVAAVLRHLDATGMRTRLGDLGVRARDVPGLAAAVEGSLANDPGPATPETVRDLYLASL